MYPVVVKDNADTTCWSTVHVASPAASVVASHRGLPAAENDTGAPTRGVPALVTVALSTYCSPASLGWGVETTTLVGAWPTQRTVSTALGAKSGAPE